MKITFRNMISRPVNAVCHVQVVHSPTLSWNKYLCSFPPEIHKPIKPAMPLVTRTVPCYTFDQKKIAI